MKITFIVEGGNIPIKYIFTDVLAAYTREGILTIHMLVGSRHVVNKFPLKDIKNLSQKNPA